MQRNILDSDDRAVKTVEPMMDELLTYDQFVDDCGTINIKVLLDHLKKEGRLHDTALSRLLERTQSVLEKEPNILSVAGPTAIFGDLHGQFYDLCNIFQDFEESDENLLFLGDYVDRGCFGTEVCILLFSLKINFPHRVYLLRGNHECRLMTTYFNFRQECLWKYNNKMYEAFMDTFDCLPLCALVDTVLGSFFCVHGGLSPSMISINDIRYIDRFNEPPEDGLFCDLLWSDPLDDTIYEALTPEDQSRWKCETFDFNSVRGCSYTYGFGAVQNFLERNDIVCLVRAHEVQQSGCRMNFDGCSPTPVAITIFSAPNYCDAYENDAAVLMIGDDELSFLSYSWVSHPFWLPKFANAFFYSMPILVQQLNNVASRVFSAIVFESLESTRDGTPSLEDNTNESSKKEDDSHEFAEFQNNLSKQKSRIAKTAKRRKTFVGSSALSDLSESLTATPPTTPPGVVSHSRLNARQARSTKRCCTLGLRGEYTDQGSVTFRVEGSRFDEVKKSDLINELRPVEMGDIKKVWNTLKNGLE